MNALTDSPTDSTSADAKKKAADPLADAGLTVPGAANGPGAAGGAPVITPPATPDPAATIPKVTGTTSSLTPPTSATPDPIMPNAPTLAPANPNPAMGAGVSAVPGGGYSSTADGGAYFGTQGDPLQAGALTAPYNVDAANRAAQGAAAPPVNTTDYWVNDVNAPGQNGWMINPNYKAPGSTTGAAPSTATDANGGTVANPTLLAGSTATPSTGAPIITPPAAGTSGVAAPSGQTPAQQLAAMQQSFITPGQQSTANNVDPNSGVTTIDPTNDLRSTVITNTPSARTADYTNQVDQAAANLPTNRTALTTQNATAIQSLLGPTAVTAGAAVDPTTSDRLKSLQSLVDQSTQSLAGVDRNKLALDQFNTDATATDPAYQLSLRQAAQRASAAGGLKSGQLRTDYGNLDLARERDLDTLRQKYMQQALSDSVNDQFQKQSALTGEEGQLTAQEAAAQAAQRQERQYSTDVSTGNANRALTANTAAATMGANQAGATINDKQTQLSDLSSLLGQSQATDTSAAAALRGERTNQQTQEQSAFDRALQQYQTEQGTQAQNFGENLALLGAGDAGNPASALTGSAATMNPGAGVSQLASALGRTSAQGGASGPVGGTGGATGGGTGNPQLDAYLAQLFGGSQQSTATATAGQGINQGGLDALLASLGGGGSGIPGVQTTAGGGY